MESIAEKNPNIAGILGKKAPDLKIKTWIDASGNPMTPPDLNNSQGKVKILFCYQPNCRGSIGVALPIIKKINEALKDNPMVNLYAIQTIFNYPYDFPPETLKDVQRELQLHMPIGYTNNRIADESLRFINDYNIVGTPWIIIINKDNQVIYNHYYITFEEALSIVSSQL
jgi:hypothetical protein